VNLDISKSRDDEHDERDNERVDRWEVGKWNYRHNVRPTRYDADATWPDVSVSSNLLYNLVVTLLQALYRIFKFSKGL